MFHTFTEENIHTQNVYEGYRLLACDGSNLSIAPNSNDLETLWKSNHFGTTGNHLHLNTLYDLLNRLYVDAVVQTASEYQEHRACIQMMEGTYDWNSFIQTLRDINYQGDFVLESHHQTQAASSEEERMALLVEMREAVERILMIP